MILKFVVFILIDIKYFQKCKRKFEGIFRGFNRKVSITVKW